jgi:hypothetical protein
LEGLIVLFAYELDLSGSWMLKKKKEERKMI